MRRFIPLWTAFAAAAMCFGGCSAVLDWDADGAPKLTPGQLLDNHCEGVFGVPLENALDSDVILFGTLLPKTGDLAQYGGPIDDAVKMAVDEMNTFSGIFGSKLALLSCDSGTSATQAAIAAQHLVDAGVPAIIGPAASGVTISVFNEILRDAGVLVISPSATAPGITDIGDDNLLWRTAPSDAFQGAAMAAYLADSGVTRIALINRNDAYGDGLSEAIRADLCTTGGGPINCSDDSVFFARKYDENAAASELAAIVNSLQTFDPELTVLIGFVEDGASFLNRVAQTTMSKRFLVTDGMKSNDLLTKVTDQEILCRLLGTQPASPSGANYQNFQINYEATFGGRQPGAFAANAYDAAYMLGYAMAATGVDNLSGAGIATGLMRLSEGEDVDVGASKWTGTIQKLASSPTATIDFDGANGPLDMDASGEAPANIELWAFDFSKSETYSLGEIFSAAKEYFPPTIDDPAAPGIGDVCAPYKQAPRN